MPKIGSPMFSQKQGGTPNRTLKPVSAFDFQSPAINGPNEKYLNMLGDDSDASDSEEEGEVVHTPVFRKSLQQCILGNLQDKKKSSLHSNFTSEQISDLHNATLYPI